MLKEQIDRGEDGWHAACDDFKKFKTYWPETMSLLSRSKELIAFPAPSLIHLVVTTRLWRRTNHPVDHYWR